MNPEEQLKPQPIQTVNAPQTTVRDQDKIMLVLAYLFPLSLIPLLTVKDSSFVQWNAKQGIVLGLGYWIVSGVLTATGILAILSCLLAPAMLVVTILAIVKSLKGEKWRIPLVADLADKF